MTLLVGNLSSQVTEENLSELFTKFGTVGNIDVFSVANFATVAIEGEANEERAVQELNGVEKFGQKLKLFKSAPVEPSDNPRDGGRRPGGSDGGRIPGEGDGPDGGRGPGGSDGGRIPGEGDGPDGGREPGEDTGPDR